MYLTSKNTYPIILFVLLNVVYLHCRNTNYSANIGKKNNTNEKRVQNIWKKTKSGIM